jgi:hypothetical protein
MDISKILSQPEQTQLTAVLKKRFDENMSRHKDIAWADVLKRIESDTEKLCSLLAMEQTGGEPDVIYINPDTDEYAFVDCAAESPKGRRSLCYDRIALESRRENKPANNVLDMAAAMGIELLNEVQYRTLQSFGTFDARTSSWILTPPSIRELGGAIFADFRYGTVFVYHNGAESYYAARGFRGLLKI